MKARKSDDEPSEPTESTEVDEETEDDEAGGRGPLVVLSVVIAVGAWRLVAVFPEVAYVVVGSIGTVGVQKARAWRAAREEGEETDASELSTPDVGEALRRLVGDGNGVLLTQLQRDLKVASTKVVKGLLEDEGIEWKAGVRTTQGNGPGVHKSAIPPAPSPTDNAHEDGCCCRSDANANTNSAEPPPREARSRVRRIRSAKAIYDPNDNIRRHTNKRTT